MQTYLNDIKWTQDGLVPAIAQDATTHRVLMMAWMNAESLQLTVESGKAVYWSRSRGQLWRKGESSGHEQRVKDIRLDCDGDAIILTVIQEKGIACHTGRESCFYRTLKNGQWQTTDPIIRDPKEIYS
jgi:phosphoribosyl-AMP cyclohydrolase